MILEIIIWIVGIAFALAALTAASLWFGAARIARTLETETFIKAPPERVWAVLVGFETYPDWNPFIRRMQGEPVEGARLTVLMQPPHRDAPMQFRPVVLEAVPARTLRWRGRLFLPGLFMGEHVFRLIPEANGTRLIHGEHFTGLLLAFIEVAAFKPGFEAMNAALKARAEA